MGTTSTETVTRTQLINMALRRVGNGSPSTDEVNNAVLALNMMLKKLDVSGRWLWAISHTATSLTTVASQAAYSVGDGASNIATNILALEHVDWVQGATDTKVDIIDKARALDNPYRSDTGQPIEVFLETAALQANQRMIFFPTPAAAYSIEYYYRRRLYDFTAATDNPDFPGEWVDTLKKALAADLAPEYGLTLPERNDLRLEAQQALRDMNATNAEDPPTHNLVTLYY